MKSIILITLPNLTTSGGVSSFWNALLPELSKFQDFKVKTIEIGGHKKNIFGPIIDQWRFKRKIKPNIDLVFLNPSLGSRSFVRDALFAKQLINKKISFVVFFHGWNLEFEKKVNEKYTNFFIKTFGHAKKIFVLSKDFKDKIIEWGYKGDVIIETTNVDSSLIENFSINKKWTDVKTSNKIKILFLARLIKEKGVFETVNAFNSIANRYDNIELTIAGDGKDLSELKNYVKDNKNINVIGRVEGEEKVKIFSDNHIYCLPSYSEGLPTTVLEAMLFGLPVITTPVGGLKEFFEDKQMGYLVEPKDIEQLEEKLELLLSDKFKMIEIGKYNNNFAKNNLLNGVMAKRLVEQINKLV